MRREKPDIDRDIANGKISRTVGWILRNSADDINYRTNIPRLTDGELEYSLRYEWRVTGRRQLERERKIRLKKRKKEEAEKDEP